MCVCAVLQCGVLSPSLPAACCTEVNDCIFIVGSEQLRHKCWKSCMTNCWKDRRTSNHLHCWCGWSFFLNFFFKSMTRLALKEKKLYKITPLLFFNLHSNVFTCSSVATASVLPLPQSHGAAVHSLQSLHGPLQTQRVKVNYVGESLSSPLLPLSVSPSFPRPPHGMWARLCCFTISSLFVSHKQRARSAQRKYVSRSHPPQMV